MFLKTFWAFLLRLFRRNKVAELEKASLYLPQNIDRIVWGGTETISIPASGSIQEFVISNGLDYCTGYAVGIYTLDGGTTYNDLGNMPPTGTPGTGFAISGLPEAKIKARIDDDTGDMYLRVQNLTTPQTATIYYAIVDFGGSGVPINDNGSLTEALLYPSAGNYRVISEQVEALENGSTIVSRSHNQGSIPYLTFWFHTSDTPPSGYEVWSTYNDATRSPSNGIKVDANNVYYSTLSTFDYSLYYKIYEDT